MKTRLLRADEPGAVGEAAQTIQAGGLVGYPTDTLYGLGAGCRMPSAIQSVFRAKGRPSDQPVPVLISKAEDALQLAAGLPIGFWRLAAEFWPGPLTLVVHKRPEVPSELSAGGQTVALRVPAHPVAVALIEAAGMPITGTSANRSGQPAPNTAQQVLAQLDGLIDAVLDGGPCPGGVQSTILDLTTARPRLLRTGAIDMDQLRDVLGLQIDT